ncbi:MAG: LacI family DNA-binding transcriptional regulator [Lachnospiraceae bacterium]|nr:LacI family DNA-binding transcriptional regulator [Lachnospiraceae bacterium]MDD3794561.1 LacI family DNA-binding transcriptional regulator [Lachnospiraceae bacterium]
MPGKVTMEEIARLAGVSKATVSRVLNQKPGVGENTRKRVIKLIGELEYDSDDRLPGLAAKMRMKNIALIIPDITNPFFGEMARTIGLKLNEKGYSLLLGDSMFLTEMEAKWIREFVSKKVDGIILAPVSGKVMKEHDLMRKFHIPCVFLDNYIEDIPNCGVVATDNELAIYTACEFLIKRGVRKIAYIGGKSKTGVSYDRLKGYMSAMQQYNIEYQNELVKVGSYTVESGYKAILELKSAGVEFEAVICANDLMALGAMNALKELSYKIPEDIQVIGYDNMFFSQYLTPALSTLQHPIIEMGNRAAEFIIKGIEEYPNNSGMVKLKTRLLLRQSTK